MGVNYRKWVSISFISLGLLGLGTQFQNCAPSSQVMAISSQQPQDPEVRVIDDWSNQKVSLSSQVFQASAEKDVLSIQGFCDRHMGASEPMSWRVRAPQDEEALLAGAVGCERGGFSLEISGLSQLECGIAYSLEVRTLDGDQDQGVIMRNCSL